MAIGINAGNAQNTTVTPAAYESLSKMSGNDAAKMKEVTSKRRRKEDQRRDQHASVGQPG